MALTKQEFAILEAQLADKKIKASQSTNLSPSISKGKRGFRERFARTFLPKSAEGFGATLGGALAAKSKDVKGAFKSEENLQQITSELGALILKNKKAGIDTTNLEKQFELNTGTKFDIGVIIPETKKSVKEIAGEAVGTLGTLAIGAAPAGSIPGRILTGGGFGGAFGAAEALRADDSAGEIIESTAKGALAGMVISGAFEGLGAAIRGASRKFGKKAFTKELQPKKDELVREIKGGFKRFGEKVRDVKDLNGQPAYRGTYERLVKQSQKELNTKGKVLLQQASKFDDVTSVSNSQAASDIITQLQNKRSILKPSELKKIQFEINRMPREMNVTEMIKMKRTYDDLIPNNFWTKVDDPAVALSSQIKYILRDNLRKLINKATNETVTPLNNDMSIAMDVFHLASEQIAMRSKRKITGEGAFLFKLVGRFIDDVLLNPKITTGAAQLGAGKGQIPQTVIGGAAVGQAPVRAAAAVAGQGQAQ